VIVLFSDTPRVAAGSFVLAAVIAVTYVVLSRPWREGPSERYKGIYSSTALRQMGFIAIGFIGVAALLVYRAVQEFMHGSTISGTLAVIGAVLGGSLGVVGLVNVVAVRRLRTGHGGRFSKRWISDSLQKAAEAEDRSRSLPRRPFDKKS
jgi:hypothetical protein